MDRLEKTDTDINRIALQLIHSLMQCFQYTVQMGLIFPIDFYVQPDPEGVARKGTAENSSILCGGGHVRCKRVSFQKL